MSNFDTTVAFLGFFTIFLTVVGIIHLILQLATHIHYLDGSNFYLYKRNLPPFRSMRALTGWGRTFTIPFFNSLKYTKEGHIVKFNVGENEDLVSFKVLFENSGIIGDFQFKLIYKIKNITKFVDANHLDKKEVDDVSVMKEDLTARLVKSFETQKLKNLGWHKFQSWGTNIATNEFKSGDYGIEIVSIDYIYGTAMVPFELESTLLTELKDILFPLTKKQK